MRRFFPIACLLAATLVAAPAQAQADRHGAYFVAAVGASHVNYDCGFDFSCDSAGAIGGKLIGGYRFGVFAIEASYTDFGNAEVGDVWRGPASLNVRAAGVGAAWYLHFSDSWLGLLRAGAAQVTQTRTDDGRHAVTSGTFGLGVVKELTPSLGLELAWDITGSEGNQTSSSLVNSVSAGLRVRF